MLSPLQFSFVYVFDVGIAQNLQVAVLRALPAQKPLESRVALAPQLRHFGILTEEPSPHVRVQQRQTLGRELLPRLSL